MCECVPRPGNLWSQMKPGGMDTAGFELETPNQFDMKDHGSCIQSAPNSLQQTQLQLAFASFCDLETSQKKRMGSMKSRQDVSGENPRDCAQ